jgi:hypothetical protein
MKKALKIILIGLGIFLICTILSIIGYDLLIFQPYYSQIKAMIQNSHPLYQHPPQALRDIATLAEGKKGVTRFVARSLLIKFERNKQRMLKWHIDYTLWTFFIEIHFTEVENFALWCSFAPYEHGVGLNESANFYYERDLDQLSFEELISLVVRVRAPSYYKQNPEKLEERVDDLLARYLSMYGDEG